MPPLLWHHIRHAWLLYYPYQPIHSPCPTYLKEGTHRVLWPDQEDTGQDGHPWCPCPGHLVNQVGFFPHPLQVAWWYPLYIPQPRNLNKVIAQEHYKAQTLNKISHQLSRAMTSGKLDARDGSWSVHLNTKSSYLTNFNIQKGRCWFLHMSFSLKMSQDIFQMCMDQSYWLPTRDHCYPPHHVSLAKPLRSNRHLIQLMQNTFKNGIIFNSSKCKIR